MPMRSNEEVEIIPVSPLRRLEKRIERVESSTSSNDREFYRELVDIIRMNQQIVDELAKSSDALRIEISKLPARLEDVAGKLEELISFIKASATEEYTPTGENMSPFADKLDQLIDTNRKIADTNQSILTALEELEKRLRRPVVMQPQQQFKRPLIPAKPI